MAQNLIENILYHYSYIQLYFLVLAYFLFLYFAIGPLFLATCKLLAKRGLVHKIALQALRPGQIAYEIKYSVSSILIFGASGIPIVYLIRQGVIEISADTPLNVVFSILLLSIWNEVHFFIIHRIMHIPFFMRNVHYIHHRSSVPTVYSVYSFHWLEALLLSTVPLCLAPFVVLPPLAFIGYPLVSILLNYAGHCNYRFGNGRGASWTLFGSLHNAHHFQFTKNYGFASDILDKLYNLIQPNRKQ